MRLDRYLAKSRIVTIQSRDVRGALQELLVAGTERLDGIDNEALLNELLSREDKITTYLSSGLALPYLHLTQLNRYLLVIGRCREGIDYQGLGKDKLVRLIVLLLAPAYSKYYLKILNSLARLLNEKAMVNRIVLPKAHSAFQSRVYEAFRGRKQQRKQPQTAFNRLFLKESAAIAREAKCSFLLLFSNTFVGGIEPGPDFPNFPSVIVTHSDSQQNRYREQKTIHDTISVRNLLPQRLSQLRSAVLIGLTRGLFQYNDRLCCLGGMPGSNRLDSIILIDIAGEFQSVLTRDHHLLPPTVKPEVIERIIAIATELAVEGREGRSVGSLFVVGDTNKVRSFTKPLILNPFYGYDEEDRNVLSPFMDETVKELSSLDGAFIIKGNGVIESAGVLLNAPIDKVTSLPSGLGARHAAAAAISSNSNSISIVVSSSSGQVTLFRRGSMLPLFEKPMGIKL